MRSFTLTSRHALLAVALPTALAFSACGNDDDDNTPVVPSQGKVLVSHAAASADVAVKAVANDKELGELTYGQNSVYLNIATGSQSLKINNASSNATIATQTATIEKDKNYSAFAYSPTTALGAVSVLVVPDDLTAPAAGKAKIRVVHLGLSAPSPISLSLPAPTTGVIDIIPNIAFGATSSFVELTPNSYNLSISSGTGTTAVVETSVGDGTGTGTGVKAYAAGKIYTVLVRGIKSSSVATNLNLKAVIIENN